jgi:hypothetical protein
VRASGRAPWSREVTLKIGDVQTVSVDRLTPLEPAAAPSPTREPAPAASVDPKKTNGIASTGLVPQAAQVGTSYNRQEQSVAVPILWATGAAILAVGSVASIAAVVNWANYKSNCLSERNYCRNQEGKDAGAAATKWGWVGTVGLALGVATWVVIPFVPKRTVRVGLSSVSFEGTF